MATMNPFDLLVDDDNGDPTQLIFVPQEKTAAKKTAPSTQPVPAKLPSKPLPPAQAVREARNEGGGRGGRGARGGGRSYQEGSFSNRGRGNFNGGRNFNRDNYNYNNNTNNGYLGGGRGGGGVYQGIEDGSVRQEDGEFGRPSERGRGGYGGGRGGGRGGRGFGGRGGFGDGAADEAERPRRQFERRSGTGRGYEVKREGAGRGNWGTQTDHGFVQETEELSLAMEEKSLTPEKQLENENNQEANLEIPSAETEEKKQEEEDKEMTLDEYEKVLEEKRKALIAMKLEERKVDVDKEFESMQQLTVKKDNDDVFIKLGSEKEMARRREIAEREERTRKPMSINEFLKPAEGEKYYAPGGRGRGRGRGDRGGFRGGFDGGSARQPAVPRIEDPGQFPTLGGK